MIRIYNGLSFASAMASIILGVASQLLNLSSIYVMVTFPIAGMYLTVIACNYFGYYIAGRLVICLGSPIWINIAHIVMGGFFCQGTAIMSAMSITYTSFEKKIRLKNALIIFQFSSICFSMLYVNIFGTLFDEFNFYLDELAVFILSVAWAAVLIYNFGKDRTELLRELKKNNEELIETSEELERFTYIASHDLKSPLRTISNFIGLIEKDLLKQDYDKLPKKLDFVKSGAEQMHFLVQNILEFSVLKSNLQNERVLIDLNTVMDKVITNLLKDIEDKNAKIYVDKLPAIVANEVEFLLLFQNLIQNGIKYNENDYPEIQVICVEETETLQIQFQDNGIGIEEKYFETIFEYFKRLHNYAKYAGTGLGLGLCKKIISSYNGQITVQSFPQKGSTFTISLPKASIYKELVASSSEFAE